MLEVKEPIDIDVLISTLNGTGTYPEKIKDVLIDGCRILVICGPTGVGKTWSGLVLARLIGTDIISADSMQVYRGMDIGTGKINTDPYGIRQYMVDLFEPDHKLTVKEFRDTAMGIIYRDFFSTRRVPLLVGGSGMYIKSLIDGIDEGPGGDKDIRKRLEREIEEGGLARQYQRLYEVDKEYASRISKNDRRRIIRALEVYALSGRPYSELQKSWAARKGYKAIFIGLDKERKALYSDIERRVDIMFDRGLIKEVESLLKKGHGSSLSLKQAVGYKEVIQFLSGKIGLEECRSLVKANSRRLAKKQMTWFRHDDRINWLRVDNYDNIFDLIKDMLRLVQKELEYEKN